MACFLASKYFCYNKFMRQKGFVEIAVLGAILLLIVGVIVSYFVIQNKNSSNTQYQVTPSTTTMPTKSTKVQQKPIEEGNFLVVINGKETLIDKGKFTNPDNIVIESIEFYEVAPDNSRIALLALNGISAFFLYLSGIDGDNVIYVDLADEIRWSHDGKHLAYTSPVTDIGPHRFMIYEVDTGTAKQLQDNELENPTKFSNFIWSDKNNTITTDYYSYKIPGGEKITEGKKTYFIEQFK
jgi:hypothetical protein